MEGGADDQTLTTLTTTKTKNERFALNCTRLCSPMLAAMAANKTRFKCIVFSRLY
jgi:hypothetical protein